MLKGVPALQQTTSFDETLCVHESHTHITE